MANLERINYLNHPTRRRMLLAAEQRFATDGYDAAKVDEIAAAAGVSKSHLYYHFDSKAELLSGLVELRTAELLAAKDELFASIDSTALFESEDHLASIITRMIVELLVPRRDFVRIVLVEAIRNPDAADPVFAALSAVLDDTANRLSGMGLALQPHTRKLWFYFGILPALHYVALSPPGSAEITADELAHGLAQLEILSLGASTKLAGPVDPSTLRQAQGRPSSGI